MSASLKLVSLNVERYKHLDTVEKFLATEGPDAACIQELFGQNAEGFARALGGASYAFEPMGIRPDEPPPGIVGIGIFSRFPIRRKEVRYYAGERGTLRESFQDDASTYNFLNRMVLICDIEKERTIFRIATTHFTWTPGGKPDDIQRGDVKNLLHVLEGMGEFVFTGDFNAPRGGEIWGELTNRYKDNVPANITSSIDPNLHRAGPLELMVDGIFSTPAFVVSGVEMISGVSDHCALAATVSKQQPEH